ncbi:hypothetical protein ACFE04_018059 [Oxalis oulophora]
MLAPPLDPSLRGNARELKEHVESIDLPMISTAHLQMRYCYSILNSESHNRILILCWPMYLSESEVLVARLDEKSDSDGQQRPVKEAGDYVFVATHTPIGKTVLAEYAMHDFQEIY